MNLKRFLQSYGFGDVRCFCLSLFPSFKYGTQTASLTASAVLGAVSEFLGLTPLLVVVIYHHWCYHFCACVLYDEQGEKQ